jgi:hypothetical protein
MMVSTGKIALAGNGTLGGLNQSVEVELGGTGASKISINDTNARTLAGIASGKIALSDFYGKSNAFNFTYTLAAGAFAQNLIITTLARNAGWNGTSKFNGTININGTLGSSNVAGIALSTGISTDPWGAPPAGSAITINVGVGGYITGAGGSFEQGGGPAILLAYPVTLNNSGYIQGGGGSGQASTNNSAYYGAGAGYTAGTGGNISNAATLEFGSSRAFLPSGGTNNGGAGGGWAPSAWNTLSDGWGFGSTSGGSNGITDGGMPPGSAIIGSNAYLVGGNWNSSSKVSGLPTGSVTRVAQPVIRGRITPFFYSGTITSGGPIGLPQLTGYTSSGSFGSLSPTSSIVTEITTTQPVKGTGGGTTVRLGGFSSDPGRGYLTIIIYNGAIYQLNDSVASNYSYGSGIATWFIASDIGLSGGTSGSVILA